MDNDSLDTVLKWVRKVGMNGPAKDRPTSVPGEIGVAVMRLEYELLYGVSPFEG